MILSHARLPVRLIYQRFPDADSRNVALSDTFSYYQADDSTPVKPLDAKRSLWPVFLVKRRIKFMIEVIVVGKCKVDVMAFHYDEADGITIRIVMV